jgi:hypothetical protein
MSEEDNALPLAKAMRSPGRGAMNLGAGKIRVVTPIGIGVVTASDLRTSMPTDLGKDNLGVVSIRELTPNDLRTLNPSELARDLVTKSEWLRSVTRGYLEFRVDPGSVTEPPAFAEFLLRFVARTKHQKAALGDLNETFNRDCKQYGRARAVRNYWGEALQSLWPLFWRMISRVAKWGVIADAIKRHLLS